VILLRTFGAIASERSRARQHSQLEAAIQLHELDSIVDLSIVEPAVSPKTEVAT